MLCNNFEEKLPCWIFNFCFRWWLEWWSLPLPSPLGFTSNSNKCFSNIWRIHLKYHRSVHMPWSTFSWHWKPSKDRDVQKSEKENIFISNLCLSSLSAQFVRLLAFFSKQVLLTSGNPKQAMSKNCRHFIKFVTIKFQCTRIKKLISHSTIPPPILLPIKKYQAQSI